MGHTKPGCIPGNETQGSVCMFFKQLNGAHYMRGDFTISTEHIQNYYWEYNKSKITYKTLGLHWLRVAVESNLLLPGFF